MDTLSGTISQKQALLSIGCFWLWRFNPTATEKELIHSKHSVFSYVFAAASQVNSITVTYRAAPVYKDTRKSLIKT